MAAYRQLWQIGKSFRYVHDQPSRRIEHKELVQSLPVPQHRRPNADHSLYARTPLDDADMCRAQSSQGSQERQPFNTNLSQMRSPVSQRSNDRRSRDRRSCRIAPTCGSLLHFVATPAPLGQVERDASYSSKKAFHSSNTSSALVPWHLTSLTVDFIFFLLSLELG
jgi:hypothetical protein